MRSGEIKALKISDFDFNNYTINISKAYEELTGKIKSPKTKNSNRIISMTPEFFEIIKEYVEVNNIKKKLLFMI